MTEELLHFIWKFKLFNVCQLQTDDGCPLEIVQSGIHNKNAGPDFFNARIKIGSTIWAGNVEMHLNASDWEKHGHSHDLSYDSIILHVVFKNDFQVTNSHGTKVPTLVISEYINSNLLDRYKALLHNQQSLPCAHQLKGIDILTIENWLERLVIERLEEKTASIDFELQQTVNNWEECFYRLLAKCFGFYINAEPFLLLARSLPSIVLVKHKNNLFQLEALLFGQAGLLNRDFVEEYPSALKTEYHHLSIKYHLKPIEPYLWKFLRLRPSNFPSIRIAQFAALVFNSSHLFSKILETESLKELEKHFEIKASAYWDNHFQFEKDSKIKGEKILGKDSIHVILINVVIPFLFFYGKRHANDELVSRALTLLENLKPEANLVTRLFNDNGIEAKNGGQSQALLHLKNAYCDRKKCLNCTIGVSILKKCYNE